MSQNFKARYEPVSTTPASGGAALFVDWNAGTDALHHEAQTRLHAARQLLFTASMAGEAPNLDNRDLQNVASAAQILVSDGLDLMEARHHANQGETCHV